MGKKNTLMTIILAIISFMLLIIVSIWISGHDLKGDSTAIGLVSATMVVLGLAIILIIVQIVLLFLHKDLNKIFNFPISLLLASFIFIASVLQAANVFIMPGSTNQQVYEGFLFFMPMIIGLYSGYNIIYELVKQQK